MSPDINQRFREQWPAIQAEWLQLLCNEPLMSPLGRPSTLVFLMEATLLQLQWALDASREPSWLKYCLPVVASVHGHCSCSLSPVTRYFSTGERALRNAGQAFSADLPEILALFQALAQHELNSLCAGCQHPDWPGCELRQNLPSAHIPP